MRRVWCVSLHAVHMHMGSMVKLREELPSRPSTGHRDTRMQLAKQAPSASRKDTGCRPAQPMYPNAALLQRPVAARQRNSADIFTHIQSNVHRHARIFTSILFIPADVRAHRFQPWSEQAFALDAGWFFFFFVCEVITSSSNFKIK